MEKTLAIATLALSLGFALGVRTEADTHALQISRTTGTAYHKVLDAWDRFQTSDQSDTDVAVLEDAVNMPEEERF